MFASFDKGQVISMERVKYQRHGYDCLYVIKFHGGPTIEMVVKGGPAPMYLQPAKLTVRDIDSAEARSIQDVEIGDKGVKATCDLKIRSGAESTHNMIREAVTIGCRYRNTDGRDDAFMSMEHFYCPEDEREWVSRNGGFVRATVEWGDLRDGEED